MARNRSRSLVRVKYGPDVKPHLVEEFKRTRGAPRSDLLHPTPGLLAARLEAFKTTVNDIVPPGTTVSIWPAIDIATTLAHVDPDRFGPDSGTSYSLDRGANVVQAKTLTHPDGTFDIVINGNWFVNSPDHNDEDLAETSQVLAHLAAHEPQHIVLELAGQGDDHVAAAAEGESATVNDFVAAAAEAVAEYRCELAANRIMLSPYAHDPQNFGDDLRRFRHSLEQSQELAVTDRWNACRNVLTASKELLKGLAYTAAYLFYDGRDDRAAPHPKPDQWDRYMGSLWPELLDMFATIPAAGEPIEIRELGEAVYRMSERVLEWLTTVGVTYRVELLDSEWQRSCWWDVELPA